jgi:hypothetical protein
MRFIIPENGRLFNKNTAIYPAEKAIFCRFSPLSIPAGLAGKYLSDMFAVRHFKEGVQRVVLNDRFPYTPSSR